MTMSKAMTKTAALDFIEARIAAMAEQLADDPPHEVMAAAVRELATLAQAAAALDRLRDE